MSLHANPDQFAVKIRDESVPRSEAVEALLELSSAKLTARDLISERVRMEVDRRLVDQHGRAAPTLIAPTEKETLLNRVTRTSINADAQVALALKAFDGNGFILLVDDTQVEALDTQIEMTPDTVVTFLKLTPLVGG